MSISNYIHLLSFTLEDSRRNKQINAVQLLKAVSTILNTVSIQHYHGSGLLGLFHYKQRQLVPNRSKIKLFPPPHVNANALGALICEGREG